MANLFLIGFVTLSGILHTDHFDSFKRGCGVETSWIRNEVIDLLESNEPFYVDIRTDMGLQNITPNQLVLITKSKTCNDIAEHASYGPDFNGSQDHYNGVFYQAGNRYIVVQVWKPEIVNPGSEWSLVESFDSSYDRIGSYFF